MRRSIPLSRGRSLGLISIFLISGFVIAGQDWFLVSMTPNEAAVNLKSFDGYTAYSWVSPMLLVCLAALGTSAISAGAARFISLLVGSISSFALTALAGMSVLNLDLSGVADEIETSTGIAATHGISGLDVTIAPMAPAAIAFFAVLGIVFLAASLSQRDWVENSRTAVKKPGKKAIDSISLWDQQR